MNLRQFWLSIPVLLLMVAMLQRTEAQVSDPYLGHIGIQASVPDSQTIHNSADTITIQNSRGAMTVSFEELIAGSPSTVSIVIKGCKKGGTCSTLETNTTTTAGQIRTPTVATIYDYFTVQGSWTGGTNVSIGVNTTLTTARNGGSGAGAVSSVFSRTGDITAQNADYSYSQISNTPQLAQTLSNASHKWLNSYDATSGLLTQTQPAFSDLSGSITTAQQPSTTVNSVSNDTNVTGSIAAQALTLGWTGTLDKSRLGTLAAGSNGLAASATTDTTNASNISSGTLPVARLPTSVLYNNTTNTLTSAGTLDTSASTAANAFKVPVVAGATATSNGALAYDSTSNNLHVANTSADAIAPVTTVTPVNGNCATWSVASGKIKLGDTGSPCGGTPGGGIIGYSATSVTLTAATRFFPVVGGGSPSTTETDVDTEAPSAATITNFYASVSTALGAGNSAVFRYRTNAADQSLTCTISGASQTSCNDSTHSFVVAAADLITIKVVTTGTIVVSPTLVMTAQFGTTGSNGTVNTGTTGQVGYYAAGGTAISGVGPGTTTTVLHGNAAGAPSFAAASLTADVSGTLPVANGGTGTTTSTGSTNVVLSNNPALVSPTFTTASLGSSYLSTTKTAGTTGTTANTLCKINSTGNVVTAAASDVGILGVCVSTQTSGNSVEVATRGIISCIADNTTVINNVAIVGTVTGGRCADSGQTNTTMVSSGVQVIGKLLSVVTAGNLASVQLYGPGHYGAQVTSTSTTNLTGVLAGNGTVVSQVTGPTSPNSVPQTLTSTPSGGVAGTPVWTLSGVPINSQAGTSYTVVAADRANLLRFTSATAVAVTLPQAGSTGFDSNFTFVEKTVGAGTVTITPTTSTINGNATLVINQGEACFVYSDNTNYFAVCSPQQLVQGSGITFTRSATGVSLSVPANVVSGSTAPGWLRYVGTGEDGTGPASGAISGVKNYTTWTCTGTITVGLNAPLIVFATGAVNLNTGCTISLLGNQGLTSGTSTNGYMGAGGGGGGGGTGAGTAGNDASFLTVATGAATVAVITSGGTAGSSSGGAGGAGTATTAASIKNLVASTFSYLGSLLGGGAGQAGGSSGAARVAGGAVFIVVAPSITIASGVYLDVSGATGKPSTANSTGPSGGGGAGAIILSTPTLTDNGAVYNVQGGPGGDCNNPEVVLSVPTGLTALTTAGTGAKAHVSTFSGGNPTVVTVDAAGSSYNYTPACAITGNGGGANTGSGATCTVTMSGATVSSIAVSGGNGGYGTGTVFTTCGTAGYGGNGWIKSFVIN